MTTQVRKNILDVEWGIICHQVNSHSVMGAGLAGMLGNRYPNAKKAYVQTRLKLGQVLLVRDAPVWIAHICGQKDYGRDGALYTSYSALERALAQLVGQIQEKDLGDLPVYFPFGMGCGLGGGDWSIVSRLIENHFPSAFICAK